MRPQAPITSADTIFNECVQDNFQAFQTPPQKRPVLHAENPQTKNLNNLFNQSPSLQGKFIQGDFQASIADTEKKNSSQPKTCNCKKTKCLKLYCDCFASGSLCGPDCSCQGCNNRQTHIQQRNKVVNTILDKNPEAFNGKIVKKQTNGKTHIKGCNCRKSSCQKKYCECFGAGAKCNELCKCEECRNMDGEVFPFSQVRQFQKMLSNSKASNSVLFYGSPDEILMKLNSLKTEPLIEKKTKLE